MFLWLVFCASLYLDSVLNTWSSCACALRKLFKRWEKVIENRRWQLPDYSVFTVFKIISSLRVKMNSIYHEGDAFLKDLHREQIMLDQDAKDISNKVLEVSYIFSNQIFSRWIWTFFSVFATRIDPKILSSGSTLPTFIPSKSPRLLQTVRNLPFYPKIQLWFPEKSCPFVLGEKLVKMLWFWTF